MYLVYMSLHVEIMLLYGNGKLSSLLHAYDNYKVYTTHIAESVHVIKSSLSESSITLYDAAL